MHIGYDDHMPFMPTVEVTDEQANRLLAAFGSIDAYRTWLRAQLTNRLREYELSLIDENTAQQKADKVQEVATFMSD